jgi:hypothetical protein
LQDLNQGWLNILTLRAIAKAVKLHNFFYVLPINFFACYAALLSFMSFAEPHHFAATLYINSLWLMRKLKHVHKLSFSKNVLKTVKLGCFDILNFTVK